MHLIGIHKETQNMDLKLNKKLIPKNFKLLHTSVGQYYNTSNIKID